MAQILNLRVQHISYLRLIFRNASYRYEDGLLTKARKLLQPVHLVHALVYDILERALLYTNIVLKKHDLMTIQKLKIYQHRIRATDVFFLQYNLIFNCVTLAVKIN